MLATAFPKFQNDVQDALKKASKHAAYDACVSMWGNQPTEDTDKIASKFADTFSSDFSDVLAPLLAIAIQTFIMNGTITGSPAGLVSPSGPVSGAISPDTVKII